MKIKQCFIHMILVGTLLLAPAIVKAESVNITGYSSIQDISGVNVVKKVENVTLSTGTVIPYYDLYNPTQSTFDACISNLKTLATSTNSYVSIEIVDYKLSSSTQYTLENGDPRTVKLFKNCKLQSRTSKVLSK